MQQICHQRWLEEKGAAVFNNNCGSKDIGETSQRCLCWISPDKSTIYKAVDRHHEEDSKEHPFLHVTSQDAQRYNSQSCNHYHERKCEEEICFPACFFDRLSFSWHGYISADSTFWKGNKAGDNGHQYCLWACSFCQYDGNLQYGLWSAFCEALEKFLGLKIIQ